MKLKAILAAAVLATMPAFAADFPDVEKYKIPNHADSAFARELWRLNQDSLVKSALDSSKGSPAESMWRAQLVVATWDEIAKSRTEINRAQSEYAADLTRYLDVMNNNGIDGGFALDHAKFIFAKLSEPIINRMEYWANGEKDRAKLAPMAALSDRLIRIAGVAVQAAMVQAERKQPFDEAGYMRAYSAQVEVEYYKAWASYFVAMSMTPGDAERTKRLADATTTLEKWTNDPESGVMYQALLLRGKAFSEMGGSANLKKAFEDLLKASQAGTKEVPNPAWVQYQARYQTVVTHIRARDFKVARESLEAFKDTLKGGAPEALISAEMLAYRVAWAEAETITDAKAQQESKLAAMKILANVIAKDARFRDLVYEQLASQIPDTANLTGLMPLQQLAVAFSKAMGQTGETSASKESLRAAVAAANTVRNNKDANEAEQLEATFIVGASQGVLENYEDAVKTNVEFITRAPKDPRSKALADVSLDHIAKIRSVAGADKVSDDIRKATATLLEFKNKGPGAIGSDDRWALAYAVSLEGEGKLKDALAVLSRLKPDHPNYVDARYNIVRISVKMLDEASANKAGDGAISTAANQLIEACAKFQETLRSASKNADKAALERYNTYKNDIFLIEVSARLNPAFKGQTAIEYANRALKILDELASQKDLPATTQGAILRYRIDAYRALPGQADKALEVVKQYAATSGQDATAVIGGMVRSTLEEIQKVEKSDPAKAQALAGQAAALMSSLVQAAEADTAQRDKAFEYKELQADLMVRAGKYDEAIKLSLELQKDQPQKLFPFMVEARAIFAQAQEKNDKKQYAVAKDYFARILPKVTQGVDSYWECWLRILQSMDAIGGSEAEIKRTLTNLRGSTSNLGGPLYKEDFEKLVLKYSK